MKTEKVFGAIIVVGLIFRLMHWPFAGLLLALGFGSLALIYLLGSVLLFCDKQIKTQNMALSIVAGIFLMSACNGILFKLMFWPFSGPTLMVAATTVPVILGVTLLLKSTTTRTDLATYYNNMIMRLSIISFFTIILFATPNTALVKIIHRDDPERVRLQTRSMMNPENEEYRREYEEYIDIKQPESRHSEENQK